MMFSCVAWISILHCFVPRNVIGIDQTPPVITPLNDVTVDNCDNLNPNITGIPKVTDNYDANPSVFYIDLADLDSCGTERNWFAKDSAGTVAILKQQIFILKVSLFPFFTVSSLSQFICLEFLFPSPFSIRKQDYQIIYSNVLSLSLSSYSFQETCNI